MSNAANVPMSSRVSDRAFYVFTGVVSVAALAFLAYILMVRRGGPVDGVDLRFLPAVNATTTCHSLV